jgi:enoyl-CoA hydratase
LDVITTETLGPVAVVTLDRPEARNALTGAMVRSMAEAFAECDADRSIRAVVLTGRDPAFCAGLDLKDLTRTFDELGAPPRDGPDGGGVVGFPRPVKPLLGAVNGPAVTGGLELALGCDFLVASERATFADTHARVGVMPAGGLTIRLPRLVGINRARQMSLTGDFIDARRAFEWGLVNEVVAHPALLDRAIELAGAVSEIDPAAVGELRSMYDALAFRSDDAVYADEARWSRRWMRDRFDPDALSARRDGIIGRGSAQQ